MQQSSPLLSQVLFLEQRKKKKTVGLGLDNSAPIHPIYKRNKKFFKSCCCCYCYCVCVCVYWGGVGRWKRGPRGGEGEGVLSNVYSLHLWTMQIFVCLAFKKKLYNRTEINAHREILAFTNKLHNRLWNSYQCFIPQKGNPPGQRENVLFFCPKTSPISSCIPSLPWGIYLISTSW